MVLYIPKFVLQLIIQNLDLLMLEEHESIVFMSKNGATKTKKVQTFQAVRALGIEDLLSAQERFSSMRCLI